MHSWGGERSAKSGWVATGIDVARTKRSAGAPADGKRFSAKEKIVSERTDSGAKEAQIRRKPVPSGEVCFAFQNGKCVRGDMCKYRHEVQRSGFYRAVGYRDDRHGNRRRQQRPVR